MGAVLVTGATGFIGSRLIRRLSVAHDVIALSRGEAAEIGSYVRGSFTSHSALQALNGYRIDSVVHLASEIGGCSEEAGLSVNVLGTRTLLRYLFDRGCRHFVLASSIAAVGCLSERFLPRELPIGDDHVCDAIDPYGLSKALMEELAFYFCRQSPDLEIAIFRIGSVLSEDFARVDDTSQTDETLLDATPLPFCAGGAVASQDVVEALALAVDCHLGAGARRMNLVAPTARTLLPTLEALNYSLGQRASMLDTAYYRADGHETASLYAIDRLSDAYGFRPSIDVRTMSTTLAVSSRTEREDR
nr:NAD(P)-dependent oxidoreductase [Phytoactinopolyspora endophytica]